MLPRRCPTVGQFCRCEWKEGQRDGSAGEGSCTSSIPWNPQRGKERTDSVRLPFNPHMGSTAQVLTHSHYACGNTHTLILKRVVTNHLTVPQGSFSWGGGGVYLWSIEDFLVLGVKVRLKDLPEKRNATWNARVPRALTARSHYGECMWKHKKWCGCFWGKILPKTARPKLMELNPFVSKRPKGSLAVRGMRIWSAPLPEANPHHREVVHLLCLLWNRLIVMFYP